MRTIAAALLLLLVVATILFEVSSGRAQRLHPVAATQVEEEGESDFPGPEPFAWGFVEGLRDGPRAKDVRVNDVDHPRTLASCNTQSETHLVSYRRNVYVGYNDARYCLQGTYPAVPLTWAGFARSHDGGKTFIDNGPLVGNNEIPELWGDPVLAVDTRGRDSGTLYYASLAYNTQGIDTLGVGVSKDSGRKFKWYDAVTGITTNDNPDKEWLAIDNTGGDHDGNLYLAWTDLGSSPDELKIARSTDGGRTWSEPLVLESSFALGVRVVVGPDGVVHVLYTKNYSNVLWTHSDDGGKSFSTPRRIAAVEEPGRPQVCVFSGIHIDPYNVLNGDMRTFTNISAAVDTFGSSRRSAPDYNPDRGSLYVTYHGHGTGLDEADVFFVRRDPSGRWTRPARLNDDETTTDQFQPEVAVPGAGRVAVVWTDRREDSSVPPPAGNRLMAQYIAVSDNGGRTFARNRRFSDILFAPPFSNPHPNWAASCYAGDYTGLYSNGNDEVYASWSDNRDAMEVTGITSSVIPDPNVYFRRERL